MPHHEYRPGEPVPGAGVYEELNVFGSPTGRCAVMAEGEELPAAARGFTWRPLTVRSARELRARAETHQRLASTAQTPAVAENLRAIAERLRALADERERRSQS